MKESIFYTSTATKLGNVGIIWRYNNERATIVRIFLPAKNKEIDVSIRRLFPGAVARSHRMIKKVCRNIQGLVAGRDVSFSREILDMLACGEFRGKVLSNVMRIPKGKVSTYGRLAERSNSSRGARAVGNALAMNPYPLIIPCHRVIRSNGSLGGFGGGLRMKRALLLMEGVQFDSKGKVLAEFLS